MTLAASEAKPGRGATGGGGSMKSGDARRADCSKGRGAGGGVNVRYAGALESTTSASIGDFEVTGAVAPEARTSMISLLGLSR